MKLPKSVYNWTTLIGGLLATVSLFLILFFIAISFFFKGGQGSYLGLLTYMVLPMFLIIGLILIPIGMVRRNRRVKETNEPIKKEWPRFDFNDSKTRNALFIFVAGTTVFILLSAVGSYQAFHYTETTEFCGALCHTVMEPEYVAYQNSPHARVTCVECHVGEGADFYVKSKMSGMYQVYANAFNLFPRPIPTPIKNLRPARETCEICHWPEKHYSHKNRMEKRFLTDEENSEWDMSLIIKIGSQYSGMGLESGIHWHINPDIKVEYIATDPKREVIPWVRFTNLKTGEVTEYNDTMNPISEEEMAGLEKRSMDCMDCHNRPSHDYKSPPNFIDHALTSGEIPSDLPFIKRQAMDLMNRIYGTKDSAFMIIERELRTFYADNYPDLTASQPEKITKAIAGIKNQFSMNIFPEMKVRWDVYPNHIGHMEFNGCFRCHGGTHESTTGRQISKDCNLCHSITAQGRPDNMEKTDIFGSLEFKHPDGDETWKEFNCTECHAYLY